MPRRFTRMSLVAGALLASIVLAACSSNDDDEVIRIYTGRHYDLELAFEQYAEETGVDIEFLTGTDAELRERIAAEGEDTQADIYMTVDRNTDYRPPAG